LLPGIRGEDAGTLVCYKNAPDTREEDEARLQLKVLGIYSQSICMYSVRVLHFYQRGSYVSAGIATVEMSVRLSVRRTLHGGIVSKRAKLVS